MLSVLFRISRLRSYPSLCDVLVSILIPLNAKAIKHPSPPLLHLALSAEFGVPALLHLDQNPGLSLRQNDGGRRRWQQSSAANMLNSSATRRLSLLPETVLASIFAWHQHQALRTWSHISGIFPTRQAWCHLNASPLLVHHLLHPRPPVIQHADLTNTYMQSGNKIEMYSLVGTDCEHNVDPTSGSPTDAGLSFDFLFDPIFSENSCTAQQIRRV